MTLPTINSFPTLPDNLIKLPDGMSSLPDSFHKLPDDFILLQVSPDIAANLWGQDEASRHWLYCRGGEQHPWTPFRKMDSLDVRQAEDQYDEGIVINRNDTRPKQNKVEKKWNSKWKKALASLLQRLMGSRKA